MLGKLLDLMANLAAKGALRMAGSMLYTLEELDAPDVMERAVAASSAISRLRISDMESVAKACGAVVDR